jgi:2,4-dienoyl-CoA reductase-like NADH-dependent reductase (Old Yellow Enzyme family)
MTSHDPLLQPYQLKHLTLRNRIMSTAHEPSYTEDGLPNERYRLYHSEKAKGGLAMTMIGGSSVIDIDSPQAFGQIQLHKDECVRWLGELADDVHSHGAAVMIQMTHMGARTNWNKADWLTMIAPTSMPEPTHRAFGEPGRGRHQGLHCRPPANHRHQSRWKIPPVPDRGRRCRPQHPRGHSGFLPVMIGL